MGHRRPSPAGVSDRLTARSPCRPRHPYPYSYDWTRTVQLAATTLVPTKQDRTALTQESLTDLLLRLRSVEDRVEHVRVIESTGMLWIGAYVAVAELEVAQQKLSNLCDRLVDVIDGWEIITDPND